MNSEDAAAQRNYATAIQALREADDLYSQVTTEFPQESRTAEQGMRNAATRMREYKAALIQNAQSLSGTGFSATARQIARSGEQETSQQALRLLVRNDYNVAVQALKRQVEDSAP